MHARKICVFLLGSSLAVAASAAGTMYRWVDESGTVHFSNLPPSGAPASEVTLSDAPPSAAPKLQAPEPEQKTIAPEAGAETAPQEDLSYAAQRRKDRSEKRQKYVEERKRRDRECTVMRRQRDQMESGPRVLVEDAEGNVRRLGDDERQQALDDANRFLRENCG